MWFAGVWAPALGGQHVESSTDNRTPGCARRVRPRRPVSCRQSASSPRFRGDSQMSGINPVSSRAFEGPGMAISARDRGTRGRRADQAGEALDGSPGCGELRGSGSRAGTPRGPDEVSGGIKGTEWEPS